MAGVRRSGRVLVVDEDERVLLLGYRDPNGDVDCFWITPGGGVNDGEDPRDAAVRELAEETGLVVAAEALGSFVVYSEGILRPGLPARDELWLLRAPHFEPDHSGMEDLERGDFLRARWWTVDEMTAVPPGEIVYPTGLAGIVTSLLRDGPPAEPTRVAY